MANTVNLDDFYEIFSTNSYDETLKLFYDKLQTYDTVEKEQLVRQINNYLNATKDEIGKILHSQEIESKRYSTKNDYEAIQAYNFDFTSLQLKTSYIFAMLYDDFNKQGNSPVTDIEYTLKKEVYYQKTNLSKKAIYKIKEKYKSFFSEKQLIQLDKLAHQKDFNILDVDDDFFSFDIM